jgi:serine/threonine-protein kinase HipA
MLKELPKRPLLAGEKGIRLSLAGAQDKIAVRIEGDEISLPFGGAPSTHILKPNVERFAGVVFNEAFAMRLATAVNLPAAKVETRTVEGIEYLLVERYDRTHLESGDLDRLHQEDFCQAQNIVPETKYQKEGGPSFKRCFQLLREAASAPVIDLAHLLDAVIFNYLVGNNDAHGKNFSLLYHVSITPLEQQTKRRL